MNVYIAPIEGKGRGLIAGRSLAPGELVCEPCPIAELEPEGLGPDVFTYTFAWEGQKRAIAFGLLSLCNHSSTPNARVESSWEERTLCLTAITPIAAGEEVTIEYGYHPPEWNDEPGERLPEPLVVKGLFSRAEVDTILALDLDTEHAAVDQGRGAVLDPQARSGAVSWICPDHDAHAWITEGLRKALRVFSPEGAESLQTESPQVASYAPGGEDHFDWHVDAYHAPQHHRRVSVIVALREAEQGGRLELEGASTAGLGVGDAIVFDARHVRHRVTPVRAGRRVSLTAWFGR